MMFESEPGAISLTNHHPPRRRCPVFASNSGYGTSVETFGQPFVCGTAA
jgi:hypothetical protein